MKLRNTFIYLIGIPAVGKYTTAKAIAKMTGAKVIDSQLINNPIFTILGLDGTGNITVPPEGWKQIAKIRRIVLSFIETEADADSSFVFTNVLADKPGDRALFRRIERIAKKRKGIFVPVWLTCEPAEIRKRKANPDRRERFKETDPKRTRYWIEEFDGFKTAHPKGLTLDTTRSKPAETAKKILAHVASVR
jgi:thymidylate kinase